MASASASSWLAALDLLNVSFGFGTSHDRGVLDGTICLSICLANFVSHPGPVICARSLLGSEGFKDGVSAGILSGPRVLASRLPTSILMTTFLLTPALSPIILLPGCLPAPLLATASFMFGVQLSRPPRFLGALSTSLCKLNAAVSAIDRWGGRNNRERSRRTGILGYLRSLPFQLPYLLKSLLPFSLFGLPRAFDAMLRVGPGIRNTRQLSFVETGSVLG